MSCVGSFFFFLHFTTGNQKFEKHTKPIMDSFDNSEYLIIDNRPCTA